MFRKRKMSAGASKAKRRATLNPFRRRPYVALGQTFRFPMYYADQPARKYVKLKYAAVVTTGAFSGGAIQEIEFRANGMYDPEVSLGGHQPYGFDQLCSQYAKWTVISSTCTAEVLTGDANQNQQWRLFTYTAQGTPNAAFASGGLNCLLELPIQSEGVVARQTGEHLSKLKTIRTYANIAKFAGKTPAGLINEKDYYGTDAADPAKIVYFGLVGWEPSLSAGTSTIIKVTIVYNAVFTEPKFFSAS